MAFLAAVAASLEAVYQNEYELDLEWDWDWNDPGAGSEFDSALIVGPSPTPAFRSSRMGSLVPGVGAGVAFRRESRAGTLTLPQLVVPDARVGPTPPPVSFLPLPHPSYPRGGRRVSILAPPRRFKDFSQDPDTLAKENLPAGVSSTERTLATPFPSTLQRAPGRRVSIIPPRTEDIIHISDVDSTRSSALLHDHTLDLKPPRSVASGHRMSTLGSRIPSRRPSIAPVGPPTRDWASRYSNAVLPFESRRPSVAPTFRSYMSGPQGTLKSVRSTATHPVPVSNFAIALVVAGSFAAQFCAIGVLNCYPTFQTQYIAEFGAVASPSFFSFVGAASNALVGITAPFVGSLMTAFGPGVVCAAGGLFIATGLALTALAMNLKMLALLALGQGILVGVGAGMVIVPSATVPPQYSSRYRGLISGISSAGGGIGGLVFVPLSSTIVSLFGLNWALIAQGVIVAVVSIGSAVPLKARYVQTVYVSSIGASSYESPTSCVGGFALYIPSFYLYDYCSTYGVEPFIASLTIGLIPGAQAASQVVWGLASHRIGYANCVFGSIALASVSCFGVWLPWQGSRIVAITFSVCWGLATGGKKHVGQMYHVPKLNFQLPTLGMLALLPIALLEMFSWNSWELRVGIVLLGNALGTMTGPPLGSVVFGLSRTIDGGVNWTWMEIFVGGTWALAAVLFGAVVYRIWSHNSSERIEPPKEPNLSVEAQAASDAPRENKSSIANGTREGDAISVYSKPTEENSFIGLIVTFIENEIEAHNESIQGLLSSTRSDQQPVQAQADRLSTTSDKAVTERAVIRSSRGDNTSLR
ncbi:MFS general substrate transporter [Gonapodya prolifera JEL478]|uniref:MFS general substrate transporter n=1 Tax=Gonapodya prolifera (strain JEL478) TaxID=1344416 RepID=A0A139AVX3_GONPJ|nr:MFS general substrate transporter [Gonapodya prolifera JEL478]|eukprot:KXS20733.1 MFS general substrate transporter [Gonapodya prolifera JEL478]